MTETFEVIFRHSLRIVIILMLPLILSIAIAYILPPSYQTQASLWALRSYEDIGSNGPQTDPTFSPAQTQTTALSDLLQSRTFALTVAKSTRLAATLNLPASTLTNPQLLDDALYKEVSTHVQTAPQGYNLYTISYTNIDPVVAKQIVEAVVQNYTVLSKGFRLLEAQNLLSSYQEQLPKAKSDAAAAATAESQYLLNHPNLNKPGGPANDPNYALLDAQRAQAQATLATVQTQISTLKQQISTQSAGTDSFFKVLDEPIVPNHPVSRQKLFLTAGGIGLAVSLLACTLYILIVVRRDRMVRARSQLQNLVPYPVIMQIPVLDTATMGYLVKDNIPNHRV